MNADRDEKATDSAMREAKAIAAVRLFVMVEVGPINRMLVFDCVDFIQYFCSFCEVRTD